jgi:hypothetical protein
MLDRLDQSAYVVVEGSSDDRVLRLVQAKLSEWAVSSYRSGSKTVAWVLRPPASRQPEPLSTP